MAFHVSHPCSAHYCCAELVAVSSCGQGLSAPTRINWVLAVPTRGSSRAHGCAASREHQGPRAEGRGKVHTDTRRQEQNQPLPPRRSPRRVCKAAWGPFPSPQSSAQGGTRSNTDPASDCQPGAALARGGGFRGVLRSSWPPAW